MNRYNNLVSLFSLLAEEFLRKGRREARMLDLRRADFTRKDIDDVTFEGNVLRFRLKDGRSWEGDVNDLRPSEINVLGEWAEMKAVEEDLGLGVSMRLGNDGRRDALRLDISRLLSDYGFKFIHVKETGGNETGEFVNPTEHMKVEVVFSEADQRDVDLAELR